MKYWTSKHPDIKILENLLRDIKFMITFELERGNIKEYIFWYDEQVYNENKLNRVRNILAG